MTSSLERKTIGTMKVGDVGYVYPSRVLQDFTNFKTWLDPAQAIYDAPNCGARIVRTETGYEVTVRPGKGSPSILSGSTSPDKTDLIEVSAYRTASRYE